MPEVRGLESVQQFLKGAKPPDASAGLRVRVEEVHSLPELHAMDGKGRPTAYVEEVRPAEAARPVRKKRMERDHGGDVRKGDPLTLLPREAEM